MGRHIYLYQLDIHLSDIYSKTLVDCKTLTGCLKPQIDRYYIVKVKEAVLEGGHVPVVA
jgi:hypothetical protein